MLRLLLPAVPRWHNAPLPPSLPSHYITSWDWDRGASLDFLHTPGFFIFCLLRSWDYSVSLTLSQVTTHDTWYQVLWQILYRSVCWLVLVAAVGGGCSVTSKILISALIWGQTGPDKYKVVPGQVPSGVNFVLQTAVLSAPLYYFTSLLSDSAREGLQ